MTVPLTVKKIETAVFSATEEADILHDRRSWRRSVGGDSITLSPSPSLVDQKCRPSLSIKRSYGKDWDTVIVCGPLIFKQAATNCYPAASEEFDHLLFEFGLELDEDVSGLLDQGSSA